MIEAARRLGIVSDLVAAPSLALGTSEVNLLELDRRLRRARQPTASACCPTRSRRCATATARLLYARQGSGLTRLLHPATVVAMQDAMASAVEWGTGKAARIGRPVAGKTGTAQDYRDAWFVGFTAELVTGVWVGNDDRRPMHKVVGGGLPARLWHDFMLAALEGQPVEPLPWPGNASEPLVANVSDPTLGTATTDGAPLPADGAGETEDDPLTALIKAIVGGQPAERK